MVYRTEDTNGVKEIVERYKERLLDSEIIKIIPQRQIQNQTYAQIFNKHSSWFKGCVQNDSGAGFLAKLQEVQLDQQPEDVIIQFVSQCGANWEFLVNLLCLKSIKDKPELGYIYHNGTFKDKKKDIEAVESKLTPAQRQQLSQGTLLAASNGCTYYPEYHNPGHRHIDDATGGIAFYYRAPDGKAVIYDYALKRYGNDYEWEFACKKGSPMKGHPKATDHSEEGE